MHGKSQDTPAIPCMQKWYSYIVYSITLDITPIPTWTWIQIFQPLKRCKFCTLIKACCMYVDYGSVISIMKSAIITIILLLNSTTLLPLETSCILRNQHIPFGNNQDRIASAPVNEFFVDGCTAIIKLHAFLGPIPCFSMLHTE